MLRAIDIPPFWLSAMLLVTWAMSWVWAGPSLGWLALGIIGLGLVLIGAAVLTMVVARTSFIPRRDPNALVMTGPFRISRNPIYLGDALVLLGGIAWWGAWAALPLLPLFMVLITTRYIRDEEDRLRSTFGADFDAWSQKVPRWVWKL